MTSHESYKRHEVPDFPESKLDVDFSASACDSCELTYDKAIVKTIDMDLDMYGNVAPFTTHICVATDRNDWVHTIEDANGPAAVIHNALQRLPEATWQDKERVVLTNTSLRTDKLSTVSHGDTLLILGPSITYIHNFVSTPDSADCLVKEFVLGQEMPSHKNYTRSQSRLRAVVLICSHMRRDARCGRTAPILGELFEEHLREQELFYDQDESEEELGKVMLIYTSHIGGHKFAGNVCIYRQRDLRSGLEAVWLGRVFPHHVRELISETIIDGRMFRPL